MKGFEHKTRSFLSLFLITESDFRLFIPIVFWQFVKAGDSYSIPHHIVLIPLS